MDNINQIKMMPEDVSAKIAAGEVSENPASVIKELVENSIDANSKQIVVEIVDGGTKFMKVSDDGVGISKNQVGLAFQRFATSKIIDWENFDNIAILHLLYLALWDHHQKISLSFPFFIIAVNISFFFDI